MPLTIAICDDNETQIKELRRLLGEWAADKPFAINIDEYISAENFLFIYPDKPCDILLLDIEMAGLNGMQLAKKLRAGGDMLPIVFITGYSDYIAEGYDVEALHYLLKPVDKAKLYAVLDKFADRRPASPQMILPCGGENIRISPENIACVEAQGRKTLLTLADGKTLICDLSISSLADMDMQGFARCHRSYIVNLRFVRSITKTDVVLDSGSAVPISRRLYDQVNSEFIRFYTGEKQ